MSSLRSRVNSELGALCERLGTLKQQDVVKAAKRVGTALHEDFEKQGLWDDAKAAERARLEYASRLIRIYYVKPSEDDRAPPVRALVSLLDDRKRESGLPGYRRIQDVLEDDDLRGRLVQTALMELRALKRKYENVKELAAVWSAVDDIDRSMPLNAGHTEQRPMA